MTRTHAAPLTLELDADAQAGDLAELLRSVEGKALAVDTETVDWEPGDPLIGPTAPRPVCATLAAADFTAFVRLHERPALTYALTRGLARIGTYVGANTSFDAHALSHGSLAAPPLSSAIAPRATPADALDGVEWLDVLVLSRAESATRRGHDLKSLTQELLGRRDMTFKEMRVAVFGQALTKRGVPYADGRPAEGRLDEERCLNHPAFRAYALADARNTYDLVHPLCSSLDGQSSRAYTAWRDLVQPQSRIAWRCERRGLPVSLEALYTSRVRAEADLATVKARLDARCPGVLWTSPAQVKAALHGAGLPVESTDKHHLTFLRDVTLAEGDPRRELASDLLEYRAADKQLAAFFRRLPLGVHEGRVHPSLRVSKANTGRDACANPNTQQMSATTDRWHLRSAFRVAPPLAEIRRLAAELEPPPGRASARPADARLWKHHTALGKLLVVCDYSAIEWVLAMHVSGDEAMLRAHEQRLDPHAYTAAGVFPECRALVESLGGISAASLKQVKLLFPKQRQSSKTLNYASLYGSGPHTLAAQLLASGVKVPATDAEAERAYLASLELWLEGEGEHPALELSAESMLRGWAHTYAGYDRWRKDLVVGVRNTVCDGAPGPRGVYTIGGRLRQVDERAMLLHGHPDSELRARYKAEGRSLVSAAIQGSAADLLHLAEIKVDADPELRALGYELLLPVHDELVGQCPARRARRATYRVKGLMVEAAKELGIVPRVEASGGWGRSWATAKLGRRAARAVARWPSCGRCAAVTFSCTG
jgi:DNA polymerase I-like protein with 3'-5' exonuclease and polymerase domains